MTKIIFTDIDDTLLNNEHIVTTNTKESISKIIKNDVHFVLATGRPGKTVYQLHEGLKLTTPAIICFGGGKIVNPKTREIIYEKGFKIEQIKDIIEFLIEEDIGFALYGEDSLYTNQPENKHLMFEAELNNFELYKMNKYEDFKESKTPKILIGVSKILSKELVSVLKTKFPEYDIFTSKPFFVEIMPKGINKGNAVKFLLEKYNIDKKDAVAFGDGNNDIEMFQAVGTSYAVENASENLKDVATKIIESNHNDGVSKIINKILANSL